MNRERIWWRLSGIRQIWLILIRNWQGQPGLSLYATITWAGNSGSFITSNSLTCMQYKGLLIHTFIHSNIHTVPDRASYIRGWIQMVLAPNDLFSWNNKYNKYNEYSITNTFTCFFLAMHTTYSVHADILKPWRGRLPWPFAVLSFYHVLSLPLSGLNWRSLFPPWGSGPPFPKMAPPYQGPRTLPYQDPEHIHTFIYSNIHTYTSASNMTNKSSKSWSSFVIITSWPN